MIENGFARGLVIADLWSAEGYLAHLEGDPLALHGDKSHYEGPNVITDYGMRYYTERAANIAGAPAQVTGMQLGTGGATPPARSGTGSAVVTYVTTSNKAIDGTHPTGGQSGAAGTAWRIVWKTSWAAGQGTANAINEVVLINQNIATNSAAPAGSTIARAILSPVDKQAGDTFAITWNQDFLGTI